MSIVGWVFWGWVFWVSDVGWIFWGGYFGVKKKKDTYVIFDGYVGVVRGARKAGEVFVLHNI